MRKHNGMRPQDIAILLKIIVKAGHPWQSKDLSHELLISPSEISESLHRSLIAGLVNIEKRKVHRQSLLEFIQYGLHYVFPADPGTMVNGIATAHSHPFMKKHFSGNLVYVWPLISGKDRGLAIEPLYKEAPHASLADPELYKMLALVDVIRVGKIREKNVAITELKKLFDYESSVKHHPHKSRV
jgi:predicted transcriptional regulator